MTAMWTLDFSAAVREDIARFEEATGCDAPTRVLNFLAQAGEIELVHAADTGWSSARTVRVGGRGAGKRADQGVVYTHQRRDREIEIAFAIEAGEEDLCGVFVVHVYRYGRAGRLRGGVMLGSDALPEVGAKMCAIEPQLLAALGLSLNDNATDEPLITWTLDGRRA